MGHTWGRQDPGGPHVGPMNFALWDVSERLSLITRNGDWRHLWLWLYIFPFIKIMMLIRCYIKAHVMALWKVIFFIMRQSANFQIFLINVIHVPSWGLNGNRLSQRVYHGNYKGSSIFYVTRNDGRLQWLANVQDYMYVCACVFQRKRGDSLVKRDIIHFRP